jgi:ring-1,2-phenylacetyl-CoA epoxidase subunit PaaC
MASRDATHSAVAAKAEKEMAYHLRHSAEWVVRLGDSTPEARRRIEAALMKLWPYMGEMFEADEAGRGLIEVGVAVDPATIAAGWRETVEQVFARATLSPPPDGWMQTGGRHGRHSEHLGNLLSELQYMQRAFPGAKW